MEITAEERRDVFGVLNVSEAARKLAIPVQEMHRNIRAGRLPKPPVLIGRRFYYRAADLNMLAQTWATIENHP